jgi:hypothetical protein
LPQGQLDDVFGIVRADAGIRKGKWSAADAGGKAALPLSAVETGLRGTARPLWVAKADQESTPVFFVNTFGKGRAYYLACDLFRSYHDVSAAAAAPEGLRSLLFVQDAMEKVLKETGFASPLTIVTRGPTPVRVPFVNSYAKELGDQRYYILVRDQGVYESSPPDQQATVVLDRTGYLYDVLAGEFLGHGNRLDIVLNDYTVRVLALLPYRVRAVQADFPAAARPGEDAVGRLAIAADGKPGLHVFRVDVLDPSGAPSRAYSRNVVAREGRADLLLPFALNDRTGPWTVAVRDVASGVSVRKTLQLNAREPGSDRGGRQ